MMGLEAARGFVLLAHVITRAVSLPNEDSSRGASRRLRPGPEAPAPHLLRPLPENPASWTVIRRELSRG
jgi:hypothetical protein